MTVTILQRIVYGLTTIFILATLIFFLMRHVGDPIDMMAGADASEEILETIRRQWGLDLPLWEQYRIFLLDLLRGDMGTSLRTRQPAVTVVLERLPATFQLAFSAMALAIIVSVPVGVIAAVRPGSWLDTVSRFVAVVGQSVPVFWLGILLIIFFSVRLGVLPAGGRGTWIHLILPSVTLSIYSIPLTMRLTRSAMLEVLNMDYIRTARSKGLSQWNVIINHGLRNALIPVITVLALRFGHVISGAIVLEEVFAYPGLGRLAIQSLLFRDFPVIQVFVIGVAALIVLTNLIADLLYTIADPRVRLR